MNSKKKIIGGATCPHCNHHFEFTEFDEFLGWNFEVVLKCPKCIKDFKLEGMGLESTE